MEQIDTMCLTTIKNYTTLKQNNPLSSRYCSLTTIKNYTTLKQTPHYIYYDNGLTTIKNYTTLKLAVCYSAQEAV